MQLWRNCITHELNPLTATMRITYGQVAHMQLFMKRLYQEVDKVGIGEPEDDVAAAYKSLSGDIQLFNSLRSGAVTIGREPDRPRSCAGQVHRRGSRVHKRSDLSQTSTALALHLLEQAMH